MILRLLVMVVVAFVVAAIKVSLLLKVVLWFGITTIAFLAMNIIGGLVLLAARRA